MPLPERVTVVEVGPRDGFQMEKTFIPTALKAEIVDRLAQAGLRKIEATSFVNPKVIPQMADSAELMKTLPRREGTTYTALVPNVKGARRAVEAGVDGVRFVLCASEKYNQRNVGMSVEESLDVCASTLEAMKPSGVPLEAAIALAFGCPFEGHVPEDRVVELARTLQGMGIREISIADSVGLGNPEQVRRLMRRLLDELTDVALSLHIHNTRGLGLANVLAAMDEGIDTFDAGLGGLGGCPIFAGATGNIPTEDLVNMCEEMGVPTGVDIEAVREASRKIQEFLGRSLPSHVLAVETREELYGRIGQPASGAGQV